MLEKLGITLYLVSSRIVPIMTYIKFMTIIRLYNNKGLVIQTFKFYSVLALNIDQINGYKNLFPECVRVTIDYAI